MTSPYTFRVDYVARHVGASPVHYLSTSAAEAVAFADRCRDELAKRDTPITLSARDAAGMFQPQLTVTAAP